jgi:hypothetical protein
MSVALRPTTITEALQHYCVAAELCAFVALYCANGIVIHEMEIV